MTTFKESRTEIDVKAVMDHAPAGDFAKELNTKPERPMLPDVISKHLAELRWLCQQWHGLLHSPELTREDLSELEKRIETHRDALLLLDAELIPRLVGDLASSDPDAVFVAAHLLLRLNKPSASDAVVRALAEADPDAMDGLRRALMHGPLANVRDRIAELVGSSRASVAITAAEALAFHGQLDMAVVPWEDFLQHEDPRVRTAAWRTMTLVDTAGGNPLFPWRDA